MHWIHENYVCENCVSDPSGKCCGNNIEDPTANFCKPDSPQGDNVIDHISQGKKIIISVLWKKSKANNRCLALYDITLIF